MTCERCGGATDPAHEITVQRPSVYPPSGQIVTWTFCNMRCLSEWAASAQLKALVPR